MNTLLEHRPERLPIVLACLAQGFLNEFGDVLFFRQIQQKIVAGVVGQVKPTLFNSDVADRFLSTCASELGMFCDGGRLC